MKDHLKATGIILLIVTVFVGIGLSDAFASVLIAGLATLTITAVVIAFYNIVLSAVRGESCAWGPFL